MALKAIVPGLLHKSDAGAVRLDLKGERAVQRAAIDMAARLEQSGHHVDGYQVQPGVTIPDNANNLTISADGTVAKLVSVGGKKVCIAAFLSAIIPLPKLFSSL